MYNLYNRVLNIVTQKTFTCSQSITETLEKRAKYVETGKCLLRRNTKFTRISIQRNFKQNRNKPYVSEM